MQSSTGTGVTDFYRKFRYTIGETIIFAGQGDGFGLYGNYKLKLRTHYDIQTASTGDISLQGVFTMRQL